MSQSTPERKPCGMCGNEYTVTANGTIRHHFTENPDFQAGPDSRKCKGAGQPPAGAAEDTPAGAPQCRICKHPVQLTGNGRARSHLTTEQTPRQCPGGPDFPLGTYPDMVGTTDGLVATIRAECDHVPVGQCYACYGEAGNPISDTELAALEEAQGTGAAPWGVDSDAVTQPTMADQLRATPFTELLEREVGDPGTVLDSVGGDTRTEAGRFLELAASGGLPRSNRVPATRADGGLSEAERERLAVVAQGFQEIRVPDQPTAEDNGLMDVYGRTKDGTVHCEECDTDNHRCKGCGDSVPHGTVACNDCDRELLARKLPAGTTDDGRRCEHHEALFGVEDDRLVCVACGTPCTHPEGFQGTADDVDEDGQDRVVSVCGLCGAADSGDELPDDEPGNPDPELPNCPHPESHRWGCGCPDDDSRDPHAYEATVAIATVEAERAEEDRQYHQTINEELARLRAKTTGPVLLGDLEVGEHFIRRGAVMRVTNTLSGDVHAVVVEGPMKGREGVLPDNHETVERTHCRHESSPGTDSVTGEIFFVCDHCGEDTEPPTKEQETKECTDDRTPTRQQPSSAALAAQTTTAPAPGSPPATRVSAQAVSPKSRSVTSSAPTATAAGKDRTAVATDQADAAAAFLGGGGRQSGAPTGPANQADAAAQFLAGGSRKDDSDRYDGYGRYKVTHPDTGKPVKWTRATTFAKAASDTFALGQYQQRLLLLGTTMRPDLRDRAHGKHVRADKKLLDSLADDLRKAAGDGVAANKGTIVHGFTEAVDHAWHTPAGPRSVLATVPPEYQVIVGTYIHLLEYHGLEPIPYLTEFTTAVKQYQVAGTSDNCYKVTKPLTVRTARGDVHLSPGEYVIGDKKSGRSLEFAQREIAIQLGTYAQGLNTSGRFDWDTRTWDPDPLKGAKVRTDVGLVVHLPVEDDSDELPSVQGVDTESGWNAAVLCERVRAWRKARVLGAVRVGGAETFAPQRPAAEPVVTHTTVRPASLEDRARAVTSKSEASAVWKQAKADGLPDAEVDELVAAMQARLRELAEPGG